MPLRERMGLTMLPYTVKVKSNRWLRGILFPSGHRHLIPSGILEASSSNAAGRPFCASVVGCSPRAESSAAFNRVVYQLR